MGGHNNKIVISKKGLFYILTALLVFLVVSHLEAMFILSKYNDMNVAAHSLKYSSFLYSMCIIFGFVWLRNRLKHWPKLLTGIGSYSFGIYLIHVPVITRVVMLLEKTAIYSFPMVYQIIVFLVVISLCCLLIGITRKLLPDAFCVKVLGFGILPASDRTDYVHQARPNIEKSLKSTTPSG